MRRDVLFALVIGLNRTNHPSIDLADIQHWDAAVGRLAAIVGPSALVETADLGSDSGLDQPVPQLAAYPELFDKLRHTDHAGNRPKSTEPDTITSLTQMKRRLVSVLTRQGFALTAALYRTDAWSGAELPFSSPPTSSADVVRPDRWIDGAPQAEWSWPETTGQTVETGTVGPATMLVWLEQHIPSQYASTLFNGYESDQFRVLTTSQHRRFEWITMWNTPASARQLAAAFDRILRRSLGDTRRHAVVQGGLKVGVVIADGDLPPPPSGSASSRPTHGASAGPDAGTADASANRADTEDASSTQPTSSRPIDQYARHLLEAKARLIPRDGLPVDFVPTRRDAFQRTASSATMKKLTWNDPATGLKLNLSPLENWKIRTSKSLPLRWLARSPDGATLQWSTTLQTPLDAPFAGETYRETLARRLSKAAEIDRTDVQITTSGTHLTVRVSPGKSDSPTSLIRQFQCGDTVHSASLGISQSTAAREDRQAVDKVIDNATDDSGRLFGCTRETPSPEDSGGNDGSIDVKMHDE
jgi:hypothetical protein